MNAYNIHDAKTHFSELIRKALNGEEVIITNRNLPVVQLVAIKKPNIHSLFGILKGKIKMASDFNDIPDGFEDYT